MRSRFWTKKKRLWIFWTKKNGLSRFSRIFELFELTPTPIPPLFISDLPTTLLNFIHGNSCLRPEKSVISEKLSKNTFAVRLFELFSNSNRFEFRPYYNFSISNSINRNYSQMVSGNSILNLIPFLIVWLQGFLGVVGGWVYTLLVRVVPRI